MILCRVRFLVAAASVTILAACRSGTDPSLGAGRTWRMGFSALPPRNDIALTLRALDLWTRRADAAIMHIGIPWAGLLQGITPDSLLKADGVGLAEYFRGKGLPLTVTLDVTDGLNRSAEAPDLVAAGRSITEPAVQQLYRGYAVAVARLLRPDFLGLAAETNLIRVAAPVALYQAVVAMTNAVVPEIRVLNGGVRLYVSVQVETAWGRLGQGGGYVGVERDLADFPFVDALGLSSYPYLGGFREPEEIPVDYYARLAGGRTLPMLLVEGGWASESAEGFVSSPERQARYVSYQAALAERAKLERLFQLSFTDLDLTSFPGAPAILPLFARLGLVDIELRPKPALAAWDEIVARPRR